MFDTGYTIVIILHLIFGLLEYEIPLGFALQIINLGPLSDDCNLFFHIVLEDVVKLDVDKEFVPIEFAQFRIIAVFLQHLSESLFDVCETVD